MPSPTATSPTDRVAPWLQFPRRAVLLLVAYTLAVGMILALRGLVPGDPRGPSIDWSTSIASRQPVIELIRERAPFTLALLGLALLAAMLLAVLLAAVALVLGRWKGAGGSLVRGVGRGSIFALAAPPAFLLVLAAIALLAFRWHVVLLAVPPVGSGPGISLRILRALIVPAFVLGFWPAVTSAQAAVGALATPGGGSGLRRWLAAVLAGLAALLGQTGGILSAAVLVEMVVGLTGLGRVLVFSAARRDMPVVLAILLFLGGLVLGARLLAELALWGARLLGRPPASLPAEGATRRTGRVWRAVALALLVIPLVMLVAGLTVGIDETVSEAPGERLQGPAAEHPWGTDPLGRDVQARVLRGAATTLWLAATAAVLATVPGVLVGALAGLLDRKRRWWSESLADILMLPMEALLLVPALPAAIALVMVLGRPGSGPAMLAPGIVLAARAAWMGRALWAAHWPVAPGWLRLVARLGALVLMVLFVGLGLVAALEFMGMGSPLPAPTLGGVLQEGMTSLDRRPEGFVAAGLALWLAAFAILTAAAALIEAPDAKPALARMNA